MRRSIAGLVALTVAITAGCGAETQDEGATNERIAVHGDWTIDIYNEDGTLDEHVEFHNDFTGAAILSRILGLTNDIVGWKVAIIGTEDLCDDGTPACYLLSVGPEPTLTVAVDNATNETILSGSTTVDVAGAIQAVEGLVDQGPVDWDFSATTIADIPVEVGQIVQVEVRYSFG